MENQITHMKIIARQILGVDVEINHHAGNDEMGKFEYWTFSGKHGLRFSCPNWTSFLESFNLYLATHI
jgi:hypothetical protein